MDLHSVFENMKNGFYSLLMVLVSFGKVPSAAAAGPSAWTGVVLIAGGQVLGSWEPVVRQGKTVKEWSEIESAAKDAGQKDLNSEEADGILAPDAEGISQFVVAPGASLTGYVVEAGSSVVDINGAEVSKVIFRMGSGGRLTVKNSLLTHFHVTESKATAPGGTMVLEDCGITGSFGGKIWNGKQSWDLVRCHFKDCQLPWLGGTSVPVTIRDCHFEGCYVPADVVKKCTNCTFDRCFIGGAANGEATTLEITETGGPSQLLPSVGQLKLVAKRSEGPPITQFWGGWIAGETNGTPVSKCLMASSKAVAPVLFQKGSPKPPGEVSIVGKVFRRLDASEQLCFKLSSAATQVQGKPGKDEEIILKPARRIEWATPQSVTLSGAPGQPGTELPPFKLKAEFSPDFNYVIVSGQADAKSKMVIKVFQALPSAMFRSEAPWDQLVGTIWAVEGPVKRWLRFETPTQCCWMDDTGKTRVDAAWRTIPGQGLVISQWGTAPAEVKREMGSKRFELSSGGKTWKGGQVRRGLFNDASEFLPGGVVDESEPTSSADHGSSAEDHPADGAVETGAAEPAGLKSRTSRINGLLVMVLDGGKMAGATSQMNAVAVPARRKDSSLAFNQETGPQMTKALEEVRKFQTVRQGKWPTGYDIAVSFADKYTGKDGPSAAVACALLLEGLFTGLVWDTAVAVTGDLNADGSVQPVGGVPAKLRGAITQKCRIIGIPAANERAVRDLLLTEGPSAFLAINLFSLKEFDQARDLALTTRPAGLATALTEFDKIIKAAPAKDKVGAWVKMPAVTAQLRKVTAAAPHHLSASLLLDYAEGRGKQTLSLSGSIEVIDREAHEVLAAIKTSAKEMNLSGIKKDGIGDSIYRLKRLRPIMHPETRRLLDSMDSFGAMIRNFFANPPRTGAFVLKAIESIHSAGSLVDEQYNALRANPEVAAELMKE